MERRAEGSDMLLLKRFVETQSIAKYIAKYNQDP